MDTRVLRRLAANYMMYIAQGRNATGRFYETFGGSTGADTLEREVSESLTTRTWYRPIHRSPR